MDYVPGRPLLPGHFQQVMGLGIHSVEEPSKTGWNRLSSKTEAVNGCPPPSSPRLRRVGEQDPDRHSFAKGHQ